MSKFVDCHMQIAPINSLPFFAYGIFRIGQISHFCIKEYIDTVYKSLRIKGRLHIRDGIPLLEVGEESGEIEGDLITFKPQFQSLAIQSIENLEPQKYYKWGVIQTPKGDANILLGRSPQKGSVAESNYWNCWDDPLFTTLFDIVDEQLALNDFDLDGKSFLKLQMTYLLLWASIERFVYLRYGFRGSEIRGKINELKNEKAFCESLLLINGVHRDIYSTDNVENKFKFIPNSPKACIDYYYQIRCNITHRGKASISDAKLVQQSLKELSFIFKRVIESAKVNG